MFAILVFPVCFFLASIGSCVSLLETCYLLQQQQQEQEEEDEEEEEEEEKTEEK